MWLRIILTLSLLRLPSGFHFLLLPGVSNVFTTAFTSIPVLCFIVALSTRKPLCQINKAKRTKQIFAYEKIIMSGGKRRGMGGYRSIMMLGESTACERAASISFGRPPFFLRKEYKQPICTIDSYYREKKHLYRPYPTRLVQVNVSLFSYTMPQCSYG